MASSSNAAAVPTASTQPPHPLAIPPGLSPDAFEVLTDLANTVARVRAALDPDQLLSASSIGGALGTAAAGTGPLSSKDVPAATDLLRHKIQRARTQMRTLPDMSRTIEEQELEIRELHARMAKQKAVLEQLRTMGGTALAGLMGDVDEGDIKMEM